MLKTFKLLKASTHLKKKKKTILQRKKKNKNFFKNTQNLKILKPAKK